MVTLLVATIGGAISVGAITRDVTTAVTKLDAVVGEVSGLRRDLGNHQTMIRLLEQQQQFIQDTMAAHAAQLQRLDAEFRAAQVRSADTK